MMPEMDGYQVCSRVHENDETSYIPVIFVTALGEEQDKARAFSVGAADYLVKPIKKDDLLQKIRKHIKTDIQWKELRENARRWREKLLPSDFFQFKEFLFAQIALEPEKWYKFSNIPPQKIYLISGAVEVSKSKIAQLIAKFLKSGQGRRWLDELEIESEPARDRRIKQAPKEACAPSAHSNPLAPTNNIR